MSFQTKSEQSEIIADQVEEYLASGGVIQHFKQGHSGIARNMPFIITKPKEKPGENWRVGDKGLRSY